MSRQRAMALALAGLVFAAWSSGPVRAQEDERINSPNEVHDQTSRHMRDVMKTLSTLRIKVTRDGDVTLIGVVSPDNHERLMAAIEQIKHITLVGSVTNHVVERTG